MSQQNISRQHEQARGITQEHPDPQVIKSQHLHNDLSYEEMNRQQEYKQETTGLKNVVNISQDVAQTSYQTMTMVPQCKQGQEEILEKSSQKHALEQERQAKTIAKEQDAQSKHIYVGNKRTSTQMYQEPLDEIQSHNSDSQSDQNQDMLRQILLGEKQANSSTDQSDVKKYKRLIQNRQSAKKCRIKKKEEYNEMNREVRRLTQENNNLKNNLNEITVLLYKKIEENQQINKKMEQNQIQHTMFLTNLLLNKEITQPNSSQLDRGGNLQMLIKDHLLNISHKFNAKEEQSFSINEFRKEISCQGTMNQQLLDMIQLCQDSTQVQPSKGTNQIGNAPSSLHMNQESAAHTGVVKNVATQNLGLAANIPGTIPQDRPQLQYNLPYELSSQQQSMLLPQPSASTRLAQQASTLNHLTQTQQLAFYPIQQLGQGISSSELMHSSKPNGGITYQQVDQNVNNPNYQAFQNRYNYQGAGGMSNDTN